MLEVVALGGLGEFGMNMLALTWGETTIGNVHWNRYRAPSAPQPMGLSGQGLMSRSCPVR